MKKTRCQIEESALTECYKSIKGGNPLVCSQLVAAYETCTTNAIISASK